MSAPTLKQPFKRAGSLVWYVCWTEGKRSCRVSTRTADLDAAKAFFATWLTMEKDGPVSGDVTVGHLWAAYREKHILRKVAAPATLEYSWKNLEPHFGALLPAAIDQDTVDDYEAKRRAGRIGRKSTSSTVRRELNALRACLGWCAHKKRKLLNSADIPDFDLPAAGAPRDRWLKMDEVKALLSAAERLRRGERLSRVERFLWLALETGARKQAILDLTWDRVDFETLVIHYDVPGRVKTKKRRANVPISPSLRPILERAFAERVSPVVMDNGADIWSAVQLTVIEAGLGGKRPKNLQAEKPKATGISPHVLRHTAATHMARNGVPLWTIAGILGNTMTMVESTYGHHCPDGLRDGVAKISKGILTPSIVQKYVKPMEMTE